MNDRKSIMSLGDWRKVEEGWYQLRSVVDSGAGARVAPPELAPFVSKRESAGSKRGQVFVSASNGEMANVGEKECHGFTDEGAPVSTVYQIVEGVDRPLDSVSAICDNGNWVAFGAHGGFIENLTTGDRTFFDREDDVYVRAMWMKMPGTVSDPDFIRQGQ